MRWSELRWLERIWVYNSIPLAIFAALGVWGASRLYPDNPVDPMGWVMIVIEIGAAMLFIGAVFVTVERTLGRSGEWRARQAIMTRGLRRPRRDMRYTVLAYPEAGKITMRLSMVTWRPRPWPLMQPVMLNPGEGSGRRIDSQDHLAIYRNWAELSDQARQRNREMREKRKEGRRGDQIATRINSQRRV